MAKHLESASFPFIEPQHEKMDITNCTFVLTSARTIQKYVSLGAMWIVKNTNNFLQAEGKYCDQIELISRLVHISKLIFLFHLEVKLRELLLQI